MIEARRADLPNAPAGIGETGISASGSIVVAIVVQRAWRGRTRDAGDGA